MLRASGQADGTPGTIATITAGLVLLQVTAMLVVLCPGGALRVAALDKAAVAEESADRGR